MRETMTRRVNGTSNNNFSNVNMKLYPAQRGAQNSMGENKIIGVKRVTKAAIMYTPMKIIKR
jgi:hypothetical protein